MAAFALEFLSMLQTAVLAFWGIVIDMSPFLLFGFLAAGLLSVLVPPSLVERHLGGRGIWPSVKAAVFGVPLPLCSCGVIPVAASLRRHGASRGATTAFLLSTPQTGVDSILVTLSLLGPVFAVFRPLAALVTGVIGGSAVTLLEHSGNGTISPAVKCTDACCSFDAGRSRLYRALHYGFVTLPQDLARSLVVGLLIAALITAVVPRDYFVGTPLGTGIPGMLVMMAIGIPIYVCATASIPVAVAFIAAGVSPGAAMVFLMTGPATNAATIVTIWNLMGRRTAVIYLATVAFTALGAGLLLDALFTVTPASVSHAHWMLPPIVNVLSAVGLIAVLANAVFHPFRSRPDLSGREAEEHAHEHETLTLAISGMHCSSCANSVQKALMETEGVESAEVVARPGQAVVTGHDLDYGKLRAAVESLGYKIESAPEPVVKT